MPDSPRLVNVTNKFFIIVVKMWLKKSNLIGSHTALFYDYVKWPHQEPFYSFQHFEILIIYNKANLAS